MEGALTGPTLAAVLVNPLHARRSVLTRIRGTFGNIVLAVVPDEARVLAVTPVAVANTNRRVHGTSAWKEMPSQRTQEPGFLHFRASPPVDPVDTLAPVQTRRAGAFVDVELAVWALEAGHTLAGVGGHVVPAGGAVLAGMLFALVDLGLAVGPCTPARRRRSRM